MTDSAPPPEDAAAIASEHRDVDALLGAFFHAAAAGVLADAVHAIGRFDDALRVHTRAEEGLFPEAPENLGPSAGESAGDALFRELRLEHVQIRELSGMIRRVLSEPGDLEAAARLAGGLARRWDAHTAREERDWLGVAPGNAPPFL